MPSFTNVPNGWLCNGLKSPHVVDCTANGKPVPIIEWLHKDKILQETTQKGNISNSYTGHTIVFDPKGNMNKYNCKSILEMNVPIKNIAKMKHIFCSIVT